jgi:membrane glycosyltransferase
MKPLEGRLAIGLVILAGVIALPIAAFAWVLGLVTLGNALLIYVLTGWAVVAAGFLSALFGHLVNGAATEDKVDPRGVPMKVKSANRS